MLGLTGYETWFYGGIFVMVSAGVLFAVQMAVFLVKRASINRKLDEEYGRPEKYHTKDERA